MIKFRCVGCNQKIGVPEAYAGRAVKCPRCSTRNTVPSVLADEELVPVEVLDEAPVESNDYELNDLEPAVPPPLQSVAEPAAELSPLAARAAERSGSDDRGQSASGRGVLASIAGLGVAAIVAGVLCIVWIVIAAVTGMEFGILAWAIGGLIGLTAGAIAKNPSPIYGGAAATVALGSILSAKLILALFILLAATMFAFVGSFDPEVEIERHAVMHVMDEEGAFTGEDDAYVDYTLAEYFGNEQDAYALEENINWDEYFTTGNRVTEAVDARRETMTPEAIDAAIETAAAAHPTWIRDHTHYIAALDELYESGSLPSDLKSQALNELAMLREEAIDTDYYDQTTPAQMRERSKTLRIMVAERLGPLDETQRDALVDQAIRRHPHWVADWQMHNAMMDQMLVDGAFTGDEEKVARQQLAQSLDGAWDADFTGDMDGERHMEVLDEVNAKVNLRLLETADAERDAVRQAAAQRHPNMDNAFGLSQDEIDELSQVTGFASALPQVFSWFDILWIGLAVTSAYTVAVKQA